MASDRPGSASLGDEFIFDESDAAGVVESSIAGSVRVITPSKPRTVTPTTKRSGSAPRSGSATRIQQLARIHEAKASSAQVPRRSLSRRQQTRQDGEVLMTAMNQRSDRGEASMEEVKFDIQVDWKSKLSELFKNSNRLEMELFRTCRIDAFIQNDGGGPSSNSRRAIRRDEWAHAEESWLRNVEKRLRTIVMSSFKKSSQLCAYTRGLEIMLFSFIDTRTIPPLCDLPTELTETLEHGGLRKVSEKTFSIQLKDSSFHRLLLHACCQFYGAKSKVG